MIGNPLPIYEFVLWDNCSNRCKFCSQSRKHNFMGDEAKVRALNSVCEFMDNIDFPSHMLLVGGEIFDSRNMEVNRSIMNAYEKISHLAKCGKIRYIYINTNLIYDANVSLFGILDMIHENGLDESVKFTTSDDLYGRFTQLTRNRYLENLTQLRMRYPKMNVMVNTIMTREFCEWILNDNVDYCGDYLRKYGCKVNLIPLINVQGEMLPEKEQIFRVLHLTDRFNDGYLHEYIENFNLRQQKRIYRYDDCTGEFVYASADELPCGHGENFSRYSSDGRCFICDVREMFG